MTFMISCDETLKRVIYTNVAAENRVPEHTVNAGAAFLEIVRHVFKHAGHSTCVQGEKVIKTEEDLDLSQDVIMITVVKISPEDKIAELIPHQKRDGTICVKLTPCATGFEAMLINNIVKVRLKYIIFQISRKLSAEYLLKALEICESAAKFQDSPITDQDVVFCKQWIEQLQPEYIENENGVFSGTISLGNGVKLELPRSRSPDKVLDNIMHDYLNIILNGVKICQTTMSLGDAFPRDIIRRTKFMATELVPTLIGQDPGALIDAGAT